MPWAVAGSGNGDTLERDGRDGAPRRDRGLRRGDSFDARVYGELAMDRLKAHSFALPYRHIIGPGAGHLVDFPYAPRQDNVDEGGGSAEASAHAAAVMWPVVLGYLAALK